MAVTCIQDKEFICSSLTTPTLSGDQRLSTTGSIILGELSTTGSIILGEQHRASW